MDVSQYFLFAKILFYEVLFESKSKLKLYFTTTSSSRAEKYAHDPDEDGAANDSHHL